LNGEKFISLATGIDAGVGHELETCTNEIGIIKMTFPGYNIVFVDTPGLDHTLIHDSDTFTAISNWLQTAYVIPLRAGDGADW